MEKISLTLIVCSIFINLNFSLAQSGSVINPADTLNNSFDITLAVYIKTYDAYFDTLSARGVDLDSSKEYKHYQRTVEALRYATNFPNFTFRQYAEDYQDWISANGMINSCVINSQYPYLSFEEIGPTKHVLGPMGYSSGTGQIHYLAWNPMNVEEMYACTNYGGLFKSTDAGGNWFEAGTDKKMPSTNVSSVALSPYDWSNTWYISTGNGEFLTSGLILPAVGVWRTTNNGASYQLISVPDHTTQQLNDNPSLKTPNDEVYYSVRTRKVISLENNANVRLILASVEGLFQCTNANAANPLWSKIMDGQFYDIEVNPANPDIIYASGDFDTPLIQYDLSTGNPPVILHVFSAITRRVSIEFCHEIDDFMYVMVAESTDGIARLYKYDFTSQDLILKGELPEDGASGPEPGVGYERAMAWTVSPVLVGGKVKIAWGNVWDIWLAEDDLTNTEFTFADYDLIMTGQIHADQHYMKFNHSATTLYVGNDGGLYKTEMSNPTIWQEMNNGLAVGTAYSVSTSQNGDRKLMSSYQDMGNHLQEPSGSSFLPWSEKNLFGGDGTEDFIHAINSDKMWCSYNFTGKYTTDNWNSSVSSNLGPADLQKKMQGDPKDNDINYGASKDGMKKRDDFTDVWYLYQNLPLELDITDANGYNFPQNIYNVFVSDNPVYGDYVYVYWRGGIDYLDPGTPIINPRIYRSKVGGGLNQADWELVYQFQTVGFGVVAVSYNDPDIFWVSEGANIYKVDLHVSTDGIPYSVGLSELSYGGVRDMVYVRGSNDGLYAATKRGLYYRDNDNYPDGWIRICAGMPNTPIYDLEIDYCRSKIITATYGRGIWESDIDLSSGSNPFSVSSDYTMTGDFYPGTDVIIEPGATLTITGTLYMPTGSKIVVKPNAKLTVQGGTITNACGGLWLGIQVWGDKTQSQFSNNAGNFAQGQVFLTQGAIIEHAEVAVDLWHPGDFNSQGGFIIAQNSTFRNNKRDVAFPAYSNYHNGILYPNKSRFTNVEFIWNNNFRVQEPLGHVSMWRVNGVIFSGCRFAEERDPVTLSFVHPANHVGIRSIDASYKVIGRCNSLSGCSGDVGYPGSTWDPTIFENLYFGIYASNATTMNSIYVDRCQFIDNGYGVELISVPSPVIIRSKFEFTNNSAHFFVTSAMHGIHAINSKMLKFEENNFVDSDPGSHGVTTLGIVSSNLGEQNEQNSYNTFTGLTYANYAQGKNKSTTSQFFGLEYPCNENNNNLYDHRVVNTLWSITEIPIIPGQFTYGVKAYTGSLHDPVGTVFTQNGSSNEDYFNTSYNDISYYLDPIIPFASIQSNLILYHSDINHPGCISGLSNNSAGILQLDPGQKTQHKNSFYSVSNDISLKEAEYEDNLLDAGEIAEIMIAIDDLAPNSKQSVRDMLNSYSPYLTTAILFEVADNAPSDYNHVWLKDLLIANIEAVTSELLLFLQTKEYPLPAPMRQLVATAMETSHTAKTDLEAEIAHLHSLRTFYSNQIIIGIQQDTIGVETDSLRYWITLQNSSLYQQHLIDAYLQEGNFDQAEIEIDNLEATIIAMPAHLRLEVSQFVSLKRWILIILQDPSLIENLTSGDLIFLRTLANRGVGTARYQAQNILCFFYSECDPFDFEFDADTRSAQSSTPTTITSEQPQFSIYPNPAGNWVMIELSASTFENLENAEIIITDISGKMVHQTNLTRNTYLWETVNAQNGVYLIIIKSSNQLFATQKVVVTH